MLDTIAEKYVKLVLNLGTHDEMYIDAYHGPAEWKKQEELHPLPLDQIKDHTDKMLDTLNNLQKSWDEDIVDLRYNFMVKQLTALKTRVEMLQGKQFPFDEESKLLYDAVMPEFSDEHFLSILSTLDAELEGKGNLYERYANFESMFYIPEHKLEEVFALAVEESKKRTFEYLTMPPEENYHIELVSDQPWTGYNWYKGNYYSLVQVNTDRPLPIDYAVNVAAHEGYPGHHVYNSLLEQHMLKERNWVEFSIYPLYSPMSFIAEGSANYGIEVAFPGDDQRKFTKEVLAKPAGIDPSLIDQLFHIRSIRSDMKYLNAVTARKLIDGHLTEEQVPEYMTKHGAIPAEVAKGSLSFMKGYRSYVINYSLGLDLVRQHVEAKGGTDDNPDKRWEEFLKLISAPNLASNLVC